MVDKTFMEEVAGKNIADIRGGLWSCIVVDPTLSGKFQESLDYVLKNGITESDLYEKDNGETFATEPTSENFNKLAGLLRINFSKEKIEALKKIGRTLYPQSTEEKKSSETGRYPQQERQTNWTAVGIGAFFGAVTGAAIGKIAIGGAAAIIGGAVIAGAAGAAIGKIFSDSQPQKE